VVRAYDSGGRIADAVVASSARRGKAAVRGFLARPDVALVQLRNVGYGCESCAVRATT
jgi:hypothetical protein